MWHLHKGSTTVVTLCAQLTRDLLAIAKFLVFIISRCYERRSSCHSDYPGKQLGYE